MGATATKTQPKTFDTFQNADVLGEECKAKHKDFFDIYSLREMILKLPGPLYGHVYSACREEACFYRLYMLPVQQDLTRLNNFIARLKKNHELYSIFQCEDNVYVLTSTGSDDYQALMDGGNVSAALVLFPWISDFKKHEFLQESLKRKILEEKFTEASEIIAKANELWGLPVNPFLTFRLAVDKDLVRAVAFILQYPVKLDQDSLNTPSWTEWYTRAHDDDEYTTEDLKGSLLLRVSSALKNDQMKIADLIYSYLNNYFLNPSEKEDAVVHYIIFLLEPEEIILTTLKKFISTYDISLTSLRISRFVSAAHERGFKEMEAYLLKQDPDNPILRPCAHVDDCPNDYYCNKKGVCDMCPEGEVPVGQQCVAALTITKQIEGGIKTQGRYEDYLLPLSGSKLITQLHDLEPTFYKKWSSSPNVIIAILQMLVQENPNVCLVAAPDEESDVYYIDFKKDSQEDSFKLTLPPNFHDNFKTCLKDSSKRFIVLPVVLSDPENAHANMILVDKTLSTAEYFEPWGSGSMFIDDAPGGRNLVFNTLQDLLEPYNLQFIEPQLICPAVGFQKIEGKTAFHDPSIDPGGFCATWSFWYAHMRVQNPDIPPDKLVKQLLDEFHHDPDTMHAYIQNYSAYLMKYVENQPKTETTSA